MYLFCQESLAPLSLLDECDGLAHRSWLWSTQLLVQAHFLEAEGIEATGLVAPG